jgi:hypothetical protein
MTPAKEIKLLRELASKLDAQAQLISDGATELRLRADRIEARAKRAKTRTAKKASAPAKPKKVVKVIRRARKAKLRPGLGITGGGGASVGGRANGWTY